MAATLATHINAAVRSGPSPVAHLISRLARRVHEYHRIYAIETAAALYKDMEPHAARGTDYHTALHMLTVAVAALNPAETGPWAVAVALSTVADPAHVGLDPVGRDLLSAVGDLNDDDLSARAVERAVRALVKVTHTYASGDLNQRQTSYQMLTAALSVLDTDEHKLATQLLTRTPGA